MFLGNQELIEDTFKKLLNYGNGGNMTLVLVVGDVKDVEDVSEKLKRQNQIVVKHILLNEAQRLKHEWPDIAERINKKVRKYLDQKKSFVFYRHGSYSNACENADEAVDEICTIFSDAYLLVVGDYDKIKEDIQNDIKIVARFAGLNKKNLRTLYRDFNNHRKRQFIGDKVVFTLLVHPSCDELSEELKKELQLPIRDLTIIYSGHSYPDGNWALDDDKLFNASNLTTVLQSIPQPQHHIKMRIYLNTCYGLEFTKKVADIRVLEAWFNIESKDKKEIFQNQNSSQQIMTKASNPDDKSEENMNLNRCITEMMLKMCEKVQDFVHLKASTFDGYIIPFAFGRLDASGILPDLYIDSTVSNCCCPCNN